MENPSIQILLADDDESDRFIFQEAFEELEIKTVVHLLNDGVQLMAYLNKKGAILPQLLFLDLNMPRKNGLECLKEIRSNEKFNDIFIAIYSTSATEKDIEETFSNGANVYIKKPADFTKLKQLLNKTVMNVLLYQELPFARSNFLLKL